MSSLLKNFQLNGCLGYFKSFFYGGQTVGPGQDLGCSVGNGPPLHSSGLFNLVAIVLTCNYRSVDLVIRGSSPARKPLFKELSFSPGWNSDISTFRFWRILSFSPPMIVASTFIYFFIFIFVFFCSTFLLSWPLFFFVLRRR